MNAPFWLAALAMVASAWALLWAAPRRANVRGVASNVGAFDAAVTALDAERAAGALDAAGHRDALAELQRRLLAEEGGAAATRTGPARASSGLRAAVAAGLAVFATAGYLALGNPAAIHIVAPAVDPVSQEDLLPMVEMLSKSMAARPPGNADDLPGWVMLARAQASLQRFGDAAAAYERAVALAPDDAQLLADLADVLTMVRGASDATPATDAAARDRAAVLVERALTADGNNLKALALAGNAAFAQRDVPAAIGFWRRARALAPAGSDFATSLDRNLADAGAPPIGGSTDATGPATSDAPRPTAVATAAGRAVVGDIRIAPALAARVGPGDTLFVFARAAQGPRMPLAILRRPASTLQEPFTLDDRMAMSPELRLSNFDAVVVGARISRSGNAMPQAGDLVGETRADAASGRIEIVIDRVQP